MRRSPLLSICIPCFGRVDYLRRTLCSIYIDNSDVAMDEYEVIISDNDPHQQIKPIAEDFKEFPNLKYFYTDCEGFMNSYYTLLYACGEFLKLHNSQMLFKKGTLRELIENVKRNKSRQTLIFYTNGLLGKFKSLEYDTFEDFMYALSYWSSWSNGFCIWKTSLDKIRGIRLNNLFPHTSLFLTQHHSKNYCINDQLLFIAQRVPKRGGHNKFEAFTIEYPSLIDQCCADGFISKRCKDYILHDIMLKFLPSLLFNKYIARIETFDATDFRKNLKIYFPSYAYSLIWLLAFIQPFRLVMRKVRAFLVPYSMK